MRQLPRPPFPFDGAWLQGGGLTLHLIDDDPTIPRKAEHDWKARSDCGCVQQQCCACAECIPSWPCRTIMRWTGPSPGTSGEARTRVRPVHVACKVSVASSTG